MPQYYSIESDSDSSEGKYTQLRPIRTSSRRRHGSVSNSHHHHHVHEAPFRSPANLAVPVVDVGGRKRASSTSGLPQPNIIINTDGGSRAGSRERHRPESHSRGRYVVPDNGPEEYYERRGRHSRSPSPYYTHGYEFHKKMEKLKIFEQEQAKEEAEKNLLAEIEIKKAKEQLEKAEQDKKKKDVAKQAVEEWQREEAAKEKKKKEDKEAWDKVVDEEVRKKLRDMNVSPSRMEALVSTKKVHRNEGAIDLARPTYIKVRRRDLLPETLDCYDLPWSYDPVSSLENPGNVVGSSRKTDNRTQKDTECILIKKYISSDLQEELFDHTRKIRSRKLMVTAPMTTETTTLKVNDRRKDQMYLVRKKDRSPARIRLFKS